jgi:hypothetical protein
MVGLGNKPYSIRGAILNHNAVKYFIVLDVHLDTSLQVYQTFIAVSWYTYSNSHIV